MGRDRDRDWDRARGIEREKIRIETGIRTGTEEGTVSSN